MKIKTTLISILIFTLMSFSNSAGAENSIDELNVYLSELHTKVNPKWDKYRGWQKNSQWVQSTVDMSLSGEIYNEGWFGPKISRQIVPDILGGWLVVDTITIGPSLLVTASTLAANILVNQVFPYVQAGPIKEKTFVNVRKVNTYEEAVLTPPFEVTKLSISPQDFENLEEEEQISTMTTGGLYIRAGGGIANLIGLELPAHINIGPKSKVTFKGSLKLTIAKDKDNHALISIERIDEMTNGLGFGFGLFFEDIVDIPVTIGVNSSNGYFPFLFNIKESRKETQSVVYDLDLKSDAGKHAYEAFLKRDFTVIEEMAELHPEEVTMDMKKVGDIHSQEVNGMVNLIIWRSGFRNIFVEGHFNTTDRAGNRFEYYELESEEIRDRKWFSNREKTSLKFMALVPSKRHENGRLIEHRGGFVLDTHFFYDDTKTKGEEIIEISDYLMESGTQMRLPFQVSEDRNYERIQIDLKVRIQAEEISDFLAAPEEDLWLSLGYALGLNDPYGFLTREGRNAFIDEAENYGTTRRRSGPRRHGSAYDEEDNEEVRKRKKMVNRAIKVINFLRELRQVPILKDKADKMIRFLRKGKEGQLLHKTLLEYIGPQKVMIRGFVRGKSL